MFDIIIQVMCLFEPRESRNSSLAMIIKQLKKKK